MIGINSTTYKVSNGQYPKLANLENARFYWNKTTGESVYLLVGDMSGNSGTNTVVDPSAMDVQSGGRQKLYCVACIFVDLANSKKGAFSVNPNGYAKDKSDTEYPVWKRYASTDSNGNTTSDGNKSKASTGYWAKVTATADEYAQYAAQKAVFVEQGLTGTKLEDALVEWVNANITGATLAVNCLFEGASYNMGWIFKQLENNGYVFESMEIRRATSGTPATTFGTAGLVLQLSEAKKILIDSDIVTIKFTNTSRGLFMYVANLKTLASVSYDKTKDSNGRRSGAYTNKVIEGVVDLSGFSKATPYNDNGYAFSQMFRESGVENVIYFNSIKATDAKGWIAKGAELAGYIDTEAFRGCTSLKTVTLTAPLTKTATNAFYGATSLEVLDLRGGVAEGATIHENTFNQVKKAITVYVYSSADYANAVVAFATVTNIKVNIVKVVSPAEEALSADGYSIRVSDENAKFAGPALRAEFTLYADKVAAAKEEKGLTLADYGVVIFSENTFKTLYNESVEAIMAAVLAGQDTDRIIRKSAFNGPYVRDYDNGDVTFAAAITGISDKNFDSAVYTYAYAAWTDGENVSYTYATYTSTRTQKTAHSLYDATVFAFRNGIVNSQNFAMSTGVELWDILKKGAFSVTASDIKAPSSLLELTEAYKTTLEAAGKFTYLDEPLRAWRFCVKKAGGSPEWDSFGHSVEDVATTNVVWSLLTDTKADGSYELIAVYRRDPNAADNAIAKLPALRERKDNQYSAALPFSSNYFAPYNSTVTESDNYNGYSASPKVNGMYKYATIYSPILNDTNAGLVTALVIDYGVNQLSGNALESRSTANLMTIVYPEGLSASGAAFSNTYSVKEVIYASDNKAALPAETQESGFGYVSDLSGILNLNFNNTFVTAYQMENIILPAQMNLKSGDANQEVFYNTAYLRRVWTVGQDVPANGVYDLSATALANLDKSAFRGVATSATIKTPTIILPATFKYISGWSMANNSAQGKTDSDAQAKSTVFGDKKSFTFDLTLRESHDVFTGASGIIAYYELYTIDTNRASYKTYMDNLKFVWNIDGVATTKSIAEWRTYFIEKGLYTTTIPAN